MFNQQESRGAIVGNLSTLALLFCLILALVVIYTLFSATLIVMRLRSLRTIQNDNFLRKPLARFNHRSANLRQIIVERPPRWSNDIRKFQRVFPFWGSNFSCLSPTSRSPMVRILSNSHSNTPAGRTGSPVSFWTGACTAPKRHSSTRVSKKAAFSHSKHAHCRDSLLLD